MACQTSIVLFAYSLCRM